MDATLDIIAWCDRHAGKGATELPAPIATERTCLGCGADLAGLHTPHGLPRIYCSAVCMKAHRNRCWRERDPEADAALSFRAYSW